MSFLFGGGKKVQTVPELTGLQVNTSVQSMPIPIIYGAPRCSLNLIYYNGFHVVEAKAGGGGGGGGKGISSGGKGGAQTQTQYFATLIMALGEGIITSAILIYQDQAVYVPSTYPTNGAFLFLGTDTQAPWSEIATNYPGDARGYKDLAYYGFPNAQLDASATVPQIGIVPTSISSGSCPLNHTILTITNGQVDGNGNQVSALPPIDMGTPDADPASVLIDFLTNQTYGAFFPYQYLDVTSILSTGAAYDPTRGDDSFQTYCQAVGFGWSFILNNAESANSVVERLTGNLNVAPVWTGSKLKFIPYYDNYSGDNPGWADLSNIPKKYFQPVLDPITVITLDQILQSDNQDEDPITYTRKDPSTVYNIVRLTFMDRTNAFNQSVSEATDESHIELYGPRVDSIGSADEFTLDQYAIRAATLRLRRNISIMRTFAFRLGPLWAFLDPMDLVQIPDPANLTSLITVRIIEIEDDENENMKVTAEEFPAGSGSPTVAPASATIPPTGGATNAPAPPVQPPVIFEPTTDMLTATGFSTSQIIVGATGGFGDALSLVWGGCNIWVSTDSFNYEQIGSQVHPAVMGRLKADITSGNGMTPDNVNTIVVDLNMSDGGLNNASDFTASNGKSLFILKDVSGFELISYVTATLTGNFTFTLTGLYRGMYGTTRRSFGAGSQFLYVGTEANYFETSINPSYVGGTFWIKLQSFNVFNNFAQDLATCVAYQYHSTGPTPQAPLAPGAFSRYPQITRTSTRLIRPRRI